MNCDQMREELPLYLGKQELPKELTDHLRGCQECQKLWQELKRLSVVLPDDTVFYLEDAELAEAMTAVEQEIQRSHAGYRGNVVKLYPWTRLAAAAMVVLCFGAGFWLMRGNVFDSRPVDSLSIGSLDSPYVILETADLVGLEEINPDYLIDEPSDAADWLIEEISEEEYKYLDEHIQAGELL